MRVGINVPYTNPDGSPCDAATLMADAKLVEDTGFEGIWIGDTIGRREMFPDPLMWLALAGAATKHVELGTAVLQLPLRNPVELAKRLLTIHALTNGRYTLGAGAGSTEADFAAVGADYEGRFKTFKRDLATIRGLCNGEQVGDANLRPWTSTLGGPPIVIGAWANGVWIKRAVEEYAGWMASGYRTDFRTMEEGIKRYRDLGGKRAMVSTIDIDLTKPDTPARDDERFTLLCTPKTAAERLQRVADLGYDDILLRTDDRSPANLAAIRALIPRHATT